MAQQYVMAIFGHVDTSIGHLVEGQPVKISDAAAASAEIQGFVTKGYIALFASLALAQAYVFTPLATRLANGETALVKTLLNTPTLTATENAAQAAYNTAVSNLTAAQAAAVAPNTIATYMAALHTANSGDGVITTANTAAQTAATTANALVTTCTTAVATALTALNNAKKALS